jgi:hypothetical protein
MIYLNSINGYALDVMERQIQWVDELWSPVGQQRRYALSGIVYTTENQRYGRPITLSAEAPWCRLRGETVTMLHSLASTPGSRFPIVFSDNRTFMVYFKRDGNPLELTPLDPRNEWYSGTLYLIEA